MSETRSAPKSSSSIDCYYHNGEFYTERKGVIAPYDRGFTLGEGIFETFLVHGHAPVRISAHLVRARIGLQLFEMTEPKEFFALPALVSYICERKKITDGVGRFTVTRSSHERGLYVNEAETHFTLTVFKKPKRDKKPLFLTIASTKRNETSPLSRIKSTCYADNILSLREAMRRGADDCLFLNTQNRVACASASNILLKMPDGRFLTPHPSEGTSPGTRLSRLAHRLGKKIIFTKIDIDTLYQAKRVYLINSVRGLRRVKQIENHRFDRPVKNI